MELDNTLARIHMAFLICIMLLISGEASAQQKSALAPAYSAASATDSRAFAAMSELPDAPDAALPQQQQTAPDSDQHPAQQPAVDTDEGKQTKRILGIVPNFRSVSVNSHLPPQTPKDKFVDFAHDSFDYSSFIFVGLLSAEAQLQGSTPEFHTGAPAFARYFWHTFADQTDENLWVGFLLPVALHQDPRFYTLGSGSASKPNSSMKRVGYALSRMVVTRPDSGKRSFNYSEVVGSGAAASISNLYYPRSNRTWGDTGSRWALNVGIDGVSFVFKEFWPDLNRAVFHKK